MRKILLAIALGMVSTVTLAQVAADLSSAYQGKTVVIYKYNSTTYCIGIQKLLANLVKEKQEESEMVRFKIVKGLANDKMISFESVGYPGRFLRHEKGRIKLHPNSGSDLFRRDATFSITEGLLSPSGVSLQSCNYPSHFIAANRKGELQKVENPNSARATFTIVEVPSEESPANQGLERTGVPPSAQP